MWKIHGHFNYFKNDKEAYDAIATGRQAFMPTVIPDEVFLTDAEMLENRRVAQFYGDDGFVWEKIDPLIEKKIAELPQYRGMFIKVRHPYHIMWVEG